MFSSCSPKRFSRGTLTRDCWRFASCFSSSLALVPRPTLYAVLLIALTLTSADQAAFALGPSSPEVQKLVNTGIDYLENKAIETRLGGRCLIALAMLKTDRPDSKWVADAEAACVRVARNKENFDVYSNGLAIIFLCELNPRKYEELIKFYLGALKRRQKPHGGWGYDRTHTTGDTSQTQYASLSYWDAHRNGIGVDRDSAIKMADWLIATQDPSGAWGYQGELAKNGKRVSQTKITCSMVSAAMGSALISADLFGQLQPEKPEKEQAEPVGYVPEGLRLPGQKAEPKRKIVPMSSSGLDRDGLFKAIQEGDDWMQKNYKVRIGHYENYYLYALERYKSFYELLEGNSSDDPQWYRDGYEYLKETIREDGSWDSGCLPANDTAFSILFLMRSTQRMLRKNIGEGQMFSGRGAPKKLATAKLSRGQVVVKQTSAAVGDLLSMIDEGKNDQLEALANDPTALLVGKVEDADTRRLAQVARSGEPRARLLAVRALARTGDLDHVPTLVYALTDPDKQVVLQSRDGLRFISRRFEGFGLADDFTDSQRYEVIDKWKAWYQKLRPDAVISLE